MPLSVSHDSNTRQKSQGRDPSAKVKRIFGDDAPSPPLIQKPPAVTTPPATAWFLKHDLEDEIAYDVKGQVKGGTLDALIERLTRHDVMDSTYNQTFLLTFKSFTTAEAFFEKLIGRYALEIVMLTKIQYLPSTRSYRTGDRDLERKSSKSVSFSK
jgi:son of sevenless